MMYLWNRLPGSRAQSVILITTLVVLLLSGTDAIGGPIVQPATTVEGSAIRSLMHELEEAKSIWLQKNRDATTEEERQALNKENPFRVFAPRFLDLARKHAGQVVAIEAVQWLAENGTPGPVVDEGLRLVQQHCFKGEAVLKLCRTLVLVRTRETETLLLTVGRQYPDRIVQGVAYLSLARYLKSFRDFAIALEENPEWLDTAQTHLSNDTISWYRAVEPAELSARAGQLCEKIVRDYGDVVDSEYRNATGEVRTLGDAASSLSFSLNPVGEFGREIVAEAINGAAINLLDFRGKVVVLMFSADWCVPCKEMYGQLRELTELYSDKPFTVMTVMADQDVSTVQKAVSSGEINWPVIWDGENGPIARGWSVTSYPTIYLIDRDGRVKHQGLRDDPLDEEVARMLDVDPESRVKVDKRTRVWHLSLRNMKMAEEKLPELLRGYTELRTLDLSYNPLSDQALAHLLSLTKLEVIHLEHTGISDKGLATLKNLKNLKELHLYRGPGHGTTAEGRRRLRNSIPELKILFTTHE